MTGYNTGLNGILFVTRADFDSESMVKTDGTLYVVQEENGFSMYLGTMGLVGVPSGGTVSDPTVIHGAGGITHIAMLTEEEYDAMDSHDPQTLYVVREEAT